MGTKERGHSALFARFRATVTAEDARAHRRATLLRPAAARERKQTLPRRRQVARGKPAPDAFLAAAAALGVPASECLARAPFAFHALCRRSRLAARGAQPAERAPLRRRRCSRTPSLV